MPVIPTTGDIGFPGLRVTGGMNLVGVGKGVTVGIKMGVAVGRRVGIAVGIGVAVGCVAAAWQSKLCVPAKPSAPQLLTADTSHL